MTNQTPLINGVIISDCADDNAIGRQKTRFASLFGSSPAFIRLTSAAPDLEGAGNLIDVLDAASHVPASIAAAPQVVLVNVAPRGGDVKERWDNGTPFCYFITGNTIVVSTFEGHVLSLARDFGIVSEVGLFDIPTVTAGLQAKNILTPTEADKINHTQFRSMEFMPLAAYWLHKKVELPSMTRSLDSLAAVSDKVWLIDCFGNVKTTVISNGADEQKVHLEGNVELAHYQRLADVPKGELAVVTGSSGYGEHRFLEIVKQGSSAAQALGLSVGSDV